MSENRVVVKAVAATAASTVIVAGILFYFFYRYVTARQRQRNKEISSFRRETVPAVLHEELRHQGGTLRGLIVDENGRDVLYLRKSDGGRFTSCFTKVWSNPIIEEEKIGDDRGEKPGISSTIQELPLLQEPCHVINFAEVEKPEQVINNPLPIAAEEPVASRQSSGASHHAPTPPLPPPTPVEIAPKQIPPPPHPPPLAQRAQPSPQPPPPPPPPKGIIPKPVPLQIPSKLQPGPPAPPLKTSGLSSAVKPSIPPRGKTSSNSRTESSIPENSNDRGEIQMKLKPLHWDKVVIDVDHSIVWNEINDGSFRFDDELIEALFGYTTPNQKSSEARNITVSATSSPTPPTQIFILDPRKSQNTAIILKSLAISRKEILDAIQDGHGLCVDILEKLTKISPSIEEAAKILQFDGNPTKLADAESFLYYILKSIPFAFTRINAMFFRSCYDPEILQLKESLQTLELSCKELRTRSIFLKLLEAILKAGNKMNAGTARGNAQGFNLSALRKLSHVKGTDGKTTLLHFVVEQVIRSEGKRCVNHQNHILGRNNSKVSKDDDRDSDGKTAREERDREYLMLGLPVVGGLSTEFSNVKKAATIDYKNFINMCHTLTIRVSDIRQIVERCGSSERSGFVREMKGFLEESEKELKVVREEQTRVMQLVKRTTEYYQAGASKDKGTDPLQLFAIVKEFLDMVDQVCVDISRQLQKSNMESAGPTPPLSPLSSPPTTPKRFQNLQSFFVPEKTGRLSSESDDDF